MEGLKASMEGFKDRLKVYLEDLKECLKILVQEMLPNGEKVFHESHDENKRNVNHDFRDSNVGFKNHHIPNIDMRKFDGKDHVAWILHMEQYFNLHDVHHTQNVCIATLYLEPNQFVWYQRLFSHKPLVTWSIFTKEMIAHHEDKKRKTLFI